MIQATLIFILGFLSAVFLAVLVAPAIWRRAVALTHRRVEATLPLTLNEIRADKDALRAEHAMAARKLEVTVKALREKIAAQSLDVDRARDAERRVTRDRDEKQARIAELEAVQGGLRAELVKREKEAANLAARIAERDRLAEEQAAEIEKLGAMYDEASFSASNRQIELVAQESRLEEQAEELSAARAEHRRVEDLLGKAMAEAQETDKAARAEKRRVVALERRAGKLTASLSDKEEKLERRERDLERLRAKLRQASDDGQELAARLAAEQDKAVRLREELALQAREIKALRAVQEKKWSAAKGDGGGEGAGERVETALLRERIDDLAAEVIGLTARLEGPDSEIERVLAAGEASDKGKTDAISLAERVRMLQKAGGRKSAG